MSYARFGWNNSDVYVFAHVGGGFECCACSIGPLVKSIYTTGYKDHPLFGDVEPCKHCNGEGCEKCMMHGSVRLDTRSEMIAHLEDHIKQGDNVPSSAIEELKKELKEEGEYNEALFPDYDGPVAFDIKEGTVKKLTDIIDELDE